ncbi:MAG TPA: NIPSNAP family protein [Planctomycetaceae bacterium]|nr:NIPSNAP family protein [Planctomycetaceae bacterium]
MSASTAAETSGARVFELRIYTAAPGKLDALNARFRDHTLRLFEKHGMKNVVYLVPTEEPKSQNTLVYLLSHESRAAADKSWDAFRKDPEWQKVKEESERDGKLVDKVESTYLSPTDYSPMKK